LICTHGSQLLWFAGISPAGFFLLVQESSSRAIKNSVGCSSGSASSNGGRFLPRAPSCDQADVRHGTLLSNPRETLISAQRSRM
jgi:hypothetical protein